MWTKPTTATNQRHDERCHRNTPTQRAGRATCESWKRERHRRSDEYGTTASGRPRTSGEGRMRSLRNRRTRKPWHWCSGDRLSEGRIGGAGGSLEYRRKRRPGAPTCGGLGIAGALGSVPDTVFTPHKTSWDLSRMPPRRRRSASSWSRQLEPNPSLVHCRHHGGVPNEKYR